MFAYSLASSFSSFSSRKVNARQTGTPTFPGCALETVLYLLFLLSFRLIFPSLFFIVFFFVKIVVLIYNYNNFIDLKVFKKIIQSLNYSKNLPWIIFSFVSSEQKY